MQVMLDSDLAKMYSVETKKLNQAVKRNSERFPLPFRFQLSENEMENLRSQIVTSNEMHGGRRYLPFAFTEQGVAMLSAVLKSSVAIAVSIEIIEAFVSLRRNQYQVLGLSQRLLKKYSIIFGEGKPSSNNAVPTTQFQQRSSNNVVPTTKFQQRSSNYIVGITK